MLGGLALGALGILRLTHVGLRRMPRGVAVATALAGAAVVFFGASYTRTSPPTRAEAAPQVSLAPIRPGSAAPRDVVHGVVRATDGSDVSDLRVDLVPFATDDPAAQTRTARTDADGAFVFTDVDVTPGTPVIADVRFDDATFPSEMLRFGRGIDDAVRIDVAQTTSQPSDIVYEVESLALVGDAKGMQAVHAVTVHNRGEHAYVGGLRLPLIPGADAIDARDGLDRRRLEFIGGELVSSAPVLPGRHDITYTYVAGMDPDGVAIRHTARYPTSRFELLAGGELDVRRTDAPSRIREVEIGPAGQKRVYGQQQFRDLDPDETLAFRVNANVSSPALRIAGLIAAVITAIGVVAFPLVRRLRTRSTPAPAHEPVGAAGSPGGAAPSVT